TPKPRSVKFRPLRATRPTPSCSTQRTSDWSTPPWYMRSCRRRPTGSSANAVTTAVSKPKQRFSPRATLYSPPPSHTSKDRAVAMRRSPGSNRTITSPRLTRSQRHSFFGRIVSAMSSLQPHFRLENYPQCFSDSRLAFSIDVGRLQPGTQKMNHGECHEISGTGDHEGNHITPGPLKHVANHRCDE